MKHILVTTAMIITSSICAFAQWTASGSYLYPTNYATTNVGVGTPTPSIWFPGKVLEIADNRPVLSLKSSTDLGTIVFTNTAINSTTHYGEFHVNHHYDPNVPAKSKLRFGSYPGPPNNDVLTLHSDGYVTIATADPKGYRLAVGGNIIAEQLVIKTVSTWPDYVFEAHYKLPTLPELEKFILANRHLPNVPSAEAVSENGINVGDMDALLLRKVEELTLYIIKLEKQNNDLTQRVQTLEKK